MNRIRVLRPDIAQRIAAGEVIERPVSVVKELVENALDAGASAISVELLAGGKSLIRVRDDGSGMSRTDAETAFVRHSTSKISTEDDLLAISTLGFRGEALPSISAVSRMTLRTSDGESGPGAVVECEAGAILSVGDAAASRGTSVEVRDLFFNLPARLKFLRGDTAELAPIAAYLTNVALAYPSLRLSGAHGARKFLDGPPVGSLRERIFQIFGKETLGRLMEIDHAEGAGSVRGFASRPPLGRPDRRRQLFFVNKRPVKDKTIAAALQQAYRGLLEKDQAPEAFLFFDVPPEEVDVNVHPAKSEVRFRRSSDIFQMVLRSVERARLKSGGLVEVVPAVVPPAERKDPPAVQMGLNAPFAVAEPPAAFIPGPSGAEPGRPAADAAIIGGRRVLGQVNDAYIVVADGEGLLVVDQHNAHERVLYDKYEEIDRKRTWPVKMTLVPLNFELAPSQALRLESSLEGLEAAGFRVEAMGGRSFALREYPDLFKPREALDVLLSQLEETEEEKGKGKRERLLATMACKSAIKAGEPLPREKMEFLVAELFKSSNPALCPHGRPIVVRIPLSQIEKGLKRI
jgi:DNA mismatch repair protein MutL